MELDNVLALGFALLAAAGHRALHEFEFRHNNRENADIFGAAIRAC